MLAHMTRVKPLGDVVPGSGCPLGPFVCSVTTFPVFWHSEWSSRPLPHRFGVALVLLQDFMRAVVVGAPCPRTPPERVVGRRPLAPSFREWGEAGGGPRRNRRPFFATDAHPVEPLPQVPPDHGTSRPSQQLGGRGQR